MLTRLTTVGHVGNTKFLVQISGGERREKDSYKVQVPSEKHSVNLKWANTKK
jgi:hypothetical protein